MRTSNPRTLFGRRVRELRVERGLSQGGIERGERNVALLNIVQLAHALHVRPADLLETVG